MEIPADHRVWTEEIHEAALRELGRLASLDPPSWSDHGRRLSALLEVIRAYEAGSR